MKKQSDNGFYDLGIAPSLLKSISKLKFKTPTPIQKESIPVAIGGDDVIALAQTGSGKTLAFGIPMLQRLAKSKNGTGLVLVPTRELAIQVEEAIHALSRTTNIRTTVIIGGASMAMQRNALKKNPRIIIATPGRLMDHLDRRTVKLNNIEVFVLDEADRMLDMGFVPDIKKIMKSIPDDRQTMLFSATMPKEIEGIAKTLMTSPTRIETDRSGTTPAEVSQETFMINNQDKRRLLAVRLKECRGPVLVFTRTKRGASKLADKVNDLGFTAAVIHSDRSQGQRRNALEGFKRGRYQILIATDIAARGIDVTGIELVVNYDMPANSEDYVHRIGRTGRAGKKGKAISFATHAQKGYIKDIERFMKIKMAISALPEMPSEKRLFKEAEEQGVKATSFSDDKPSTGKAPRRSGFKRKDERRSDKKRSVSKVRKTGRYDGDVPDRKRWDKKKSDPKSYGMRQAESKDSEFRRKDSDSPSSKYRKYNKTDSKNFSQKRDESNDRDFRRKDTDRPDSKYRRFNKSDSKKSSSKWSETKENNFKRKDSKHSGSKRKFSKSKGSQPAEFSQNESNNENSFWSKFKKKRPSKKKSVGQGNRRKRRPKAK